MAYTTQNIVDAYNQSVGSGGMTEAQFVDLAKSQYGVNDQQLWDARAVLLGQPNAPTYNITNQYTSAPTATAPKAPVTSNSGVAQPTYAPSAATQPPAGSPNTSYGGVEYEYPNYWDPLVQNASNYAAGLPGQIQGTYDNWFGQDLSASFNPNLNTAFQQAGQVTNPWQPQVQQAASNLQDQFQPLVQQAAQYDPNELQKYLNPYIQNAADATTAAVNRNLTENLIPQLNSTFAGAGQFGSTRSADFTNRALRDTQSALAEKLGALNYGAYQQANQTYSDWANKAQQAANAQLNYANTQGSLANLGANMSQQDFNNLLNAGKYQQETEQANIDRTYNDWLTRQQYPVKQMGALSQVVGGLSSGVRPNQYNVGNYTPPATTDALTRALTAAGIGAGALADADIQNLIKAISGSA